MVVLVFGHRETTVSDPLRCAIRKAIASAGVGIKPDAVDRQGNLDNSKIWFHVTPAVDLPDFHIFATVVEDAGKGPVERASFGCHFGPAVNGEPKSYTAASCDRSPLDVKLTPGATLTAKVVVRVFGAGKMHPVPIIVD